MKPPRQTCPFDPVIRTAESLEALAPRPARRHFSPRRAWRPAITLAAIAVAIVALFL